MQIRRDPGVGHILLVGRVGKEQRSYGHDKVMDPETNLRRPGHRQNQESPSRRQSEGPGGWWRQGGLAVAHHLGRRVGTIGKRLAADSRSKRVGIWLPGELITEASTRARTSGFRGRAAAPGITGGGGGRKTLEGMGVDVTGGDRQAPIAGEEEGGGVALAFQEPRRSAHRNEGQSQD